MSWKTLNIIDLSTISGSTDRFRTAVGGFWNYFSESEGSGYEFVEMDKEDPIDDHISLIDTNTDLVYTYPTMFPAYRVPIRIWGNDEFVKSDKYWKNFIMGGTFGTMSFDGVYITNVHDSYYMQCQMPYSKQEANILEYTSEIGSTLATVQCTYEYNHFYPEYEQSILGKSIKLIPNMYLIQAYQNSDDDAGEIPDRYMVDGIKEFINREGIVSDDVLSNLLARNYVLAMPPPDSAAPSDLIPGVPGHIDTNLNLRNYLTGTYVQTNLSASTRSAINNILSNIYHDGNFYSTLYEDLEYDFGDVPRRKSFPFYIKIILHPIVELPCVQLYKTRA
jgi:hypothetical protein